jgi:hypothetical protein
MQVMHLEEPVSSGGGDGGMIRLRKVQLRLFTAALLVLLFITSTAAEAALIATDDNNVLKSAAGTTQPNGTTINLKESSTSQSNARLGFIKFDLSSIAVSAFNEGSFTVTSADVAGAGYTLRAYALNAGSAGFNWTESTITYTNRPALNNTTNPLVDTTKATAVGADIIVANSTALGTDMTFSFANLENYRQADDTLTFILLVTSQSATGPSFLFASSESVNQLIAPRLTVTAIPEPASIGLVGLCLLGVLVRSRRK